MKKLVEKMSPGLESQILRTMVNKGTKKLCKAAYKPRACDYLVAVRESWITFFVSNSQYILSHKWRDTQTMDIGEPVYMVEKFRLVKRW